MRKNSPHRENRIDTSLLITAAGVIVALFIGSMQVWIALQQHGTADTQAELSRLQGELQSRQSELQTVSSWLPFLTNDDRNVRLVTVLALERIEGEAAIAPLVTALVDDDSSVRNHAARALAQRVNQDNTDLIVEVVASVFENQDQIKAEAALNTLVKIGGRSVERIRLALQKPLTAETRQQAEQAIERILLNEQVMKKIGVFESHNITRGSPEILVAMVGGGVDYTVDDLAEALVEEVDHVGSNSRPALSTSFAARLIVGHPESDIVGVSPDVRLLSEKVLGDQGGGTFNDIIAGIDHATQSGARVIYIELGSSTENELLGQSIERAHQAGALVIAAGGNHDSEMPNYPAAMDNVLAVSATDFHDRKAAYSSYADWIDISAPGNPTHGSEGTASTQALQGTSFSGSLVAGAAALVWSVDPTASSSDVRTALLKTANDLDALNPEYAGKLGAGRLNVLAAVRYMLERPGAVK